MAELLWNAQQKEEITRVLKKYSNNIEDNLLNIYKKVDIKCIPIFTTLLLNSGVDPLQYLDIIPMRYLYGTEISSIIIPDNIKRIEDGAFALCTKLKVVILSKNLEQIGERAFAGCSNIRKISIPKSVKAIEYKAFLNCHNLKDIYYEGTKDEFKKIVIDAHNFYSPIIKCTDGPLEFLEV